MIVKDINIESLFSLLKELPNEKQYLTHSIILAKGRYKYRPSIFGRIKKLING